MANGEFDFGGDVIAFDPGLIEAPIDPGMLVIQPEVPQFGLGVDAEFNAQIQSPYLSTSEVLREGSVPAPTTPKTFDWTQVGESFVKAGQTVANIVKTGGDIYALATGKPTSTQRAAAERQRLAAKGGIFGNRAILLLVVGGGIVLLIIMRGRRGRR